jgi:acetyl esterase/lipase
MSIVRRLPLLAVFLLALSACRVTDWRIWHPVSEPSIAECEVECIRDIAYYRGPHFDRVRHKLDLFIPKGRKDYPVVMLVHGGAWIVGDNRCCGLYSSVGEYLARQGIGAVLPNYRLSPFVKHPDHVKDVARAFAWTKQHLAEHGGDTLQITLVGHSAGGHLVALLATDEQYLQAEGCQIADIRGVVGVSGVYRIPAGKAEIELGGSSQLALRLDEMAPLRGISATRDPNARPSSGLPVGINIFAPAFGNDASERRSASPVHHVRKGLPPFLLLSADHDLPILPDLAEEMHQTLRKHAVASRLVTIENRNHNSILFKAVESSDPAARLIVDFVRAPTAAH